MQTIWSWRPTRQPVAPRAEGQVGLTESLALAQAVRDLVAADQEAEHKRTIIAVVVLPSQAYGRYEEMAWARTRRWPSPPMPTTQRASPVTPSGRHGLLQANQILALDDPGVEIHAMHQAAAARITCARST